MATKNIRKVAVEASDIAGLKTSRFERMQAAFGVVPAATYASGDVLVFGDIPAQDVIRGTIVIHASTPVTLEIHPGTGLSSNLAMTAGSAARISYTLFYIRGTGSVGTTGPGEVLKLAVTIA